MDWLPTSASTFAPQVDSILWLVTIISVVSCILVGFLLIYFVVKYRKRSDNDQTPAITHDSFLETLWTVIPTILCILIFIYGYVYYDKYTTPTKGAYEINVTAQRWSWSFAYPNGKKTFNELYVPVNKPVRLVMQSKDVLHSFFVPAFRVKQDVIGNRYTFINFTPTKEGVFDIYCTEYCGISHSDMLAKVHVVSDIEYAKWESGDSDDVENAYAGMAPDKIGEQLYSSKGCVACHSIDGANGVGPSWKALFGQEREFTDGTKEIADENYIKTSILYPVNPPQGKVVKGYAPVMPSYQGLLTDSEITAIIEYIKTIK